MRSDIGFDSGAPFSDLLFQNLDTINPYVLLIPGPRSHLAVIVVFARPSYPTWLLLGKLKAYLLNHPTIDAVPNVSQLHGQLVDYFLLVMVLANAILLGLRRQTVVYIDRREFQREY